MCHKYVCWSEIVLDSDVGWKNWTMLTMEFLSFFIVYVGKASLKRHTFDMKNKDTSKKQL